MEVVNALGRRKRAIARVFVSEGTVVVVSLASLRHCVWQSLAHWLR